MGPKKNIHRLITTAEGIYLPSVEARCTTNKYMLGVVARKYWPIKIADVKIRLVEKTRWSKVDMIAYIDSLIINCPKLGFSTDALPDRAWLVNVLFTLEPNHDVFVGAEVNSPLFDILLVIFCFFNLVSCLSLDSFAQKL